MRGPVLLVLVMALLAMVLFGSGALVGMGVGRQAGEREAHFERTRAGTAQMVARMCLSAGQDQ